MNRSTKSLLGASRQPTIRVRRDSLDVLFKMDGTFDAYCTLNTAISACLGVRRAQGVSQQQCLCRVRRSNVELWNLQNDACTFNIITRLKRSTQITSCWSSQGTKHTSNSIISANLKQWLLPSMPPSLKRPSRPMWNPVKRLNPVSERKAQCPSWSIPYKIVSYSPFLKRDD